MDRGLVFGAAAGAVDVFDAQDEPTLGVPGGLERGQRRKRMAAVQVAGRRGRETGDEGGL
jgi:hypothetical protein